MKLSILLPTLKTYGGVRRFVNLANCWTDHGHRATIYTPDGEPCGWLPSRFRVKKQDGFLRQRHEIVMFGYPAENDLRLAREAKARVKVFYLCMVYDVPGLADSKMALPQFESQTRITRAALSDREFIKLSNSTWMRDYAANCFPESEVGLLIGGVDNSIFRPVLAEKISRSVLTPLEQRKWKSLRQMKEVYQLVRRGVPEATIGTYRGKDLEQSAMAEFICRHEIFVDDTILAGWHNPVIEAMACGVPVACYNIGAVRDFAVDGETALLAPKKNARALAGAAVRLLKDPGLRQKISDNALEFIKRFSWDAAVDKLEVICR